MIRVTIMCFYMFIPLADTVKPLQFCFDFGLASHHDAVIY